MENKARFLYVYLAALIALALGAVAWAAVSGFPAEIVPRFAVVAALALFFSVCVPLRITQAFSRTPAPEALVVAALPLFGGPLAVFLALVESVAAHFGPFRLSRKPRPRRLIVEAAGSTIGIFVAAYAVNFIFGSPERVLARENATAFVWLLVVIALAAFLVKSLATAGMLAIEGGRPLWKAWNQVASREAFTSFAGAALAGAFVEAAEEYSLPAASAVAAVIGLAAIAVRLSLNYARNAAEAARRFERERAERAELELRDLESYVEELESSLETLRQSHENFRHAAFHDELTGLPNRNYFMDRLRTLLNDARENAESNFAILLLDLKRFKTINDSLGHSMGDRLIRNVAKRLAQMVREDDMVARFSGDKFGIILTDLVMKDEAIAFAERLSKRIAEPYTLDGRQVFTSVKTGIAFGNSKYAEAEDLLRDADIAMYYAKDHDEDHVIFDQKMHVRAVTRLQLETDLRFAIERREFEMYYQPIIGLDTATLVGFEALVRWNHPQRGLVPPGEFIPIAENTGLIVPMTVQILHTACAQVKRWQQKFRNFDRPLSIAVNLSGKHFAHPALVSQINAVLEESGIDPQSLKLELTESAVMENAEMAILMLKQIKETGVQVSIDDFGTGYSSLSYLHRFPIDLLKVDRSFVSAMEENTENGEIVRTVIALAKALNLKVVAEGIESIHQFHQLRVLGCEYGQGYLFSKPQRAVDAERLLEDRDRWKNILLSAQPPLARPDSNIAPFRLAG
jgi:diguanylate cyclase (GGDEF)-like protein